MGEYQLVNLAKKLILAPFLTIRVTSGSLWQIEREESFSEILFWQVANWFPCPLDTNICTLVFKIIEGQFWSFLQFKILIYF